MKQEYSYGAVVYQIKDGQILYLIEFRKLGHVSLPKGHIEKGETPFQCALREIKEETNLEVDLETSFHHTISYSPFPNVWKEVTFYLAKAKTFDIISQPEEVKEAKWMSFKEARETLTFQSDKDTLTDADNYRKKHEEAKRRSPLQ